MPVRRISDEQREWLQRQLADWSQQELVTADQAARILALYETAEETGARKRSHFSFAILGLAAFMIGLALFLLIGYNWDAIPRPGKLLLIFATLLGTYAGGLYLRFVRQAPRASEIVFFLGCLFYGAGIWLVAQVFHLSAHYPDGIWWWAIGVVPFALCLDSMLVHCLLVALLALWSGMEVIGFTHLAQRLFWGWWSIPNGAYTLPILAVPGVLWAYRHRSPATVGLYATLLGWWVVLQAIAWEFDALPVVYLIGILGCLYLIVAESHGDRSPYAIPIRLLGVAQLGGALVVLSFGGVHREGVRRAGYDSGSSFVAGFAECIAFLAIVACSLVIVAYLRPQPAGPARPPFARLLDVARRQHLPLGVALGLVATWFWTIVSWSSSGDDGLASWLPPTIVANVAMLGLAHWLMRVGLREDRGRPFAFGVLYFLLWAVLRYVDLFADAGGMLGASLMFFLCGAALFGVGMFWHRRKKETVHV